MFLATRLLAGFKIAFPSPSENPSHFLSIRSKYLQVLKFVPTAATLWDPLPNYIQERHLLAKIEKEKKRKSKNQQVPKWSCAFNQGLNYLTMKMSFPGLMRVAQFAETGCLFL